MKKNTAEEILINFNQFYWRWFIKKGQDSQFHGQTTKRRDLEATNM